jgi:hypothetical protein
MCVTTACSPHRLAMTMDRGSLGDAFKMPCYSDKELENSPSRSQGLSAEAELQCVQQYAALLWDVCHRLLMCESMQACALLDSSFGNTDSHLGAVAASPQAQRHHAHALHAVLPIEPGCTCLTDLAINCADLLGQQPQPRTTATTSSQPGLC